jgi:hypothetical protein
MLPLIFRTGDRTKQIFVPSHPSIKMRGLLCLKKIAGARTESEERYSIEFKGKHPVITQGMAALKRRDWHRNRPFLLERTKTQLLQRVSSSNLLTSCGILKFPASIFHARQILFLRKMLFLRGDLRLSISKFTAPIKCLIGIFQILTIK